MPAVAARAPILGEELSRLSRDDHRRLEQITWILRQEVRRDPNDMTALIALTEALSLGGHLEELTACAHRAYLHLKSLPVWLQTNLLFFTVAIGAHDEANSGIEALLSRTALSLDEKSRVHTLGTAAALRFGDLGLLSKIAEISAEDSGANQSLRFIASAKLDPWWQRQQQAVEAALGRNTTHFLCTLQTDADLTTRLILHYYTDAAPFTALDRLQERVDDALERVYSGHPEGVAAILDTIIIAVHRPFIPSPESP